MSTIPSRFKRVAAFSAAFAVGLAMVAVPSAHAAGAATSDLNQAVNTAPGARGSIAILPDTQFYSRYGVDGADLYSANYPGLPNPFDSQTQWIVDNAAKYNIAITQHLGDVVDQAGKGSQYLVADRAMKILEDAKQPYAIIPGNHDSDIEYHNYKVTFPEERQAKSSTFQAISPSGLGNWHRFSVAGVQMISINMTWDAQEDDLAWAEGVLNANPNVPTIITSHQIINIAADSTALDTAYGDKLWDRLIKSHNQVFLTLNGHHHGATNKVRTNDDGQPVFQQLLDYQMAYQGGNGLMALMEFDFTNNQLSQTSFSPWVLQKPKASVNAFDRAVLEDAGATWTINYDFAKRFATFGATVKPTGSIASATQDLRDSINQSFTPIEGVSLQAATSADDYPKVDGTLAHWRPEEVNGKLQMTDISGNGNDMSLQFAGEAKEGDGSVGLSDDHPLYSADSQSMRFDPISKHNFSFFATGDNAPLNKQRFPNGYTFETFIRIDENFDADVNAWMAYIARGGKRLDLVDLIDANDLEEPPSTGAISNLREVQWAFVENKKQGHGYSAWSGDVDLGTWLHIAVVDDPKQGAVILYVDGAPMLRNVYATEPGAHGISGLDDKPWVIGGSIYDELMDTGWFGNIGETRFIDHPTTPDQWLTARTVKQPDDAQQPADTTEQPGDAQQPGEDVKPGGADKPDVIVPSGDMNPSGDAGSSMDGRQTDGSKSDKTFTSRPTSLPKTGGEGYVQVAGLAFLALVGAAVVVRRFAR